MKNYIVTIIVIVIVIVIGAFAFTLGRGPETASALDGFAQCLAEKGWTMYGAYWCPHCQNEKKAFGDSWQYVKYVECTEEPNVCTAASIRGFPTWVAADGRRFEGEQGVVKLAAASGCALKNQK